MSSPTQRTLAHLRAAGYPLVQVLEKWIPQARRRVDLHGIANVLAIGDDIFAVQCTFGSNVAARVRKITDSEALPSCAASVSGSQSTVSGRCVASGG